MLDASVRAWLPYRLGAPVTLRALQASLEATVGQLPLVNSVQMHLALVAGDVGASPADVFAVPRLWPLIGRPETEGSSPAAPSLSGHQVAPARPMRHHGLCGMRPLTHTWETG